MMGLKNFRCHRVGDCGRMWVNVEEVEGYVYELIFSYHRRQGAHDPSGEIQGRAGKSFCAGSKSGYLPQYLSERALGCLDRPAAEAALHEP